MHETKKINQMLKKTSISKTIIHRKKSQEYAQIYNFVRETLEIYKTQKFEVYYHIKICIFCSRTVEF